MSLTFLDLILLALATWRLSYMVTSEQGWFGIFARLRTIIGGATTCMYCFSVWAGAFFYITHVIFLADWLTWVFAISALALVIRSYTGAGLHDIQANANT